MPVATYNMQRNNMQFVLNYLDSLCWTSPSAAYSRGRTQETKVWNHHRNSSVVTTVSRADTESDRGD